MYQIENQHVKHLQTEHNAEKGFIKQHATAKPTQLSWSGTADFFLGGGGAEGARAPPILSH